MAVIEPARLSGLIAQIYDCAIDPALWPVAMEAIRCALGLQLCSLDLASVPDGKSVLNFMTNVPDPWAQRVDLMPRAAEMWGGMASLLARPIDAPAVLSRTVGLPDESWTMPFYVEWAAPQGICDVMALPLARDERGFGAMSFGRHRDSPPIDDRMVDLGRLLIPHLQRAAAINRLLDLADLRTATFSALFDALSAPVLIVDGELTLVHVNRAGRAVLDRNEALQLRGPILAATDRGTQQALAAAARDAARDYLAFGQQALTIPLTRGEGGTSVLHILPLRPDHADAPSLAAIFMAETDRAPVPTASLAEALFGLTPSESAVFEQIGRGLDVPRAASALGTAPSTVRTHLQHIYDKTGVRRQAELVRLSSSLCAPAAR